MNRDGVEVHKLKKRTRPVSNHRYQTSLVNKGFILWLLGKFFLWDTVGLSPEREGRSILPTRVANQSTGFGSAHRTRQSYNKKVVLVNCWGNLTNIPSSWSNNTLSCFILGELELRADHFCHNLLKGYGNFSLF